METVQMSKPELERYALIKRVVGREVKQSIAAKQLSLSVRQIKRLCAKYREFGAQGVFSKQRGKPSNRQSKPERRERIMMLVREHYADFGPLLASEYLREQHGQTTRGLLYIQKIPFALSLSKGLSSEGFDRLSPNGDL
jgi:transposase